MLPKLGTMSFMILYYWSKSVCLRMVIVWSLSFEVLSVILVCCSNMSFGLIIRVESEAFQVSHHWTVHISMFICHLCQHKGHPFAAGSQGSYREG